jgi:iron-sulfur cluster assembly protein
VDSPRSTTREEANIVLTVTHEAAEAIQTLTEGIPETDTAGLRISVQEGEGGTAQIALSVADAPFPADEVVQAEGATVYVAEPVVAFLDDKTLDASVQDEGVAFSIQGPAEDGPSRNGRPGEV